MMDYITNMAKLTVSINDELDRKVRTAISASGGKKGDLSKTVEEALQMWLSPKEKKTATAKKGA
jgi:Arc/MetJ-type ribon-helix-helix transcriptional regulator